jgi:hypothetical protein
VCSFEAEVVAIGAEPDAHAIAVAAGDASLVLVDHDATHLSAYRVTDTVSAPTTIELDGAATLFALEAATATHFLALTLGQCTVDGHASPCAHAVAIETSADAITTHGTRTVLFPAPLRSSRIVAASDAVYYAHTHQGAPPAMHRFTNLGGDLAVVSTPLGQGDPALATEPCEILGLTASGGSYAVLWRRGATEDAASSVMLTTQLDEHQIASLHDALVVESMAWLAGSLSVVVSLEFARPSYVRLGADGELRGPAELLRFGEAPPAPFTTDRTALVRGSAGELTIRVRNAAGDAVGDPIPLDPDVTHADVARIEGGFRVATLAQGGDVALRTLRCP